MLELLAPAGNLDAVIAAVQNGADAVYMGFGDGFNARRSADNFTRESFAKAVRYCHIRGCKVYVTLIVLIIELIRQTSGFCHFILSFVHTGTFSVFSMGLTAATAYQPVRNFMSIL